MVDPSLVAGRVLAGRYQLESQIGMGGFGTVWRAQHLVLEAPVAVKLIDPEIAEDPRAIERFLREAKALASLRSPHVVQILDYGVEDQQPFMAMELLEGESLAERIERLGRLPAEQMVRVVVHVARAISRAHEAGVVHRDLKPENVFLVQNDDDEIAKVLDFGVAKIAEGRMTLNGTATRTGALIGTPFYMSPEQALGNKEIDFRSDLWSLGVIAFESITGKRPFSSDGLGELMLQITVRELPVPSAFGAVPPGFDEWFARAMNRDPEGRFGSAREMAEALRAALGLDDPGSLTETPTRIDPLPSRPLGPKWAEAVTVAQFGTSRGTSTEGGKSRRGLLIGIGGTALAIGLLGGLLVLGAEPAPNASRPMASPSHLHAASNPVDTTRQSATSPEANPGAPRPIRHGAGSAAPGPSRNARVLPGNGGTASAAASGRDSRGKVQEPPAEWRPKEVDGQWIKPQWAQPDEPDSDRTTGDTKPAPSAPMVPSAVSPPNPLDKPGATPGTIEAAPPGAEVSPVPSD